MNLKCLLGLHDYEAAYDYGVDGFDEAGSYQECYVELYYRNCFDGI